MKNLISTFAGMAMIVIISGAVGYASTPDRRAFVPPVIFSWPEGSPAAPQTLSLPALKSALDAGSKIVLLDARSGAEYEAGHIKGALSLPPSAFTSRYPALGDRLPGDAELVVYCGATNCELDVQLATLLMAQGRGDVKLLSGGWTGWLQAGYPTETGASR